MATVTTSHYQIFDYWKDKCITKRGEVKSCNEFSASKEDMIVITDWGEPMCFACEKYAVRSADEEAKIFDSCNSEEEFDYKNFWNHKNVKSGFERAHILPGALGGKDEPNNLFLLCPECHFLSPDTDNPHNFLRWVYKQRKETANGKMHPFIAFEKIREELKDRGVLLDTVAEDLDVKSINYDDFQKYANVHLGLHATSAADSTIIMGFADYIIHKWDEARTKMSR